MGYVLPATWQTIYMIVISTTVLQYALVYCLEFCFMLRIKMNFFILCLFLIKIFCSSYKMLTSQYSITAIAGSFGAGWDGLGLSLLCAFWLSHIT
jgi:hypothetical protein